MTFPVAVGFCIQRGSEDAIDACGQPRIRQACKRAAKIVRIVLGENSVEILLEPAGAEKVEIAEILRHQNRKIEIAVLAERQLFVEGVLHLRPGGSMRLFLLGAQTADSQRMVDECLDSAPTRRVDR